MVNKPNLILAAFFESDYHLKSYSICDEAAIRKPSILTCHDFMFPDFLINFNGMPKDMKTEEALNARAISFLNKEMAFLQSVSFLGNCRVTKSGDIIVSRNGLPSYSITASWPPKPDHGGRVPLANLPRAFSAIGIINFNNDNYLVAEDCDSHDGGPTLALLSMTVSGSVVSHNIVSALFDGTDFPKKIIGDCTFQANVQRVMLVGARIFVLVVYSEITDSETDQLMYSRSNQSEVREYRLSASGSSIAIDLVGTQSIRSNSFHLYYYEDGLGTGYLFSDCIGDDQGQGDVSRADPCISIVKLLPSGGFDSTWTVDDISGHETYCNLP